MEMDGSLKCNGHAGSAIEAVARDAAIVVSIALQCGADLEVIRDALTKDHDGTPATLLGAALDALLAPTSPPLTLVPSPEPEPLD